jgi:uridine kinase
MSHIKPLVIGIAGGTGSGKTSVTLKIEEAIDKEEILIMAHDSYYKDLSTHGGLKPEEINFDHPSSLETDLLIEHLRHLKKGQPVEQPVYDFTTHRRAKKPLHLMPKEIIILEGILILTDKDLRNLLDIKLFVDTDADERLLRRIRRDIHERGRTLDSVMHQYMATVKPMHLEFVEPSKQWADVIIPRGAENTVAIEMVVTAIKSLMERRRKH